MANVKEIAAKAAKWWADKLRHPEDIRNFDNGEDSFQAALMSVLASDLALVSTVHGGQDTNNAIACFEKELAKRIEAEIQNPGALVQLYTDYHPEGVLEEIAGQVGLPEDLFPWKTGMHVYHDKIVVSDGNDQQYVQLP